MMIGFVIDHEKFNLTKKTDQNPSIYIVNELAKMDCLQFLLGQTLLDGFLP